MLVRCVRYKFTHDYPFINPVIDYGGLNNCGLTIGKIYQVQEEFYNGSFDMYRLINDFDSNQTYHARLFETISEERDKKIVEILC